MYSFFNNLKSALKGLKVAFFEEKSLQLQFLAAVVVLILSFLLSIPKTQLVVLIFTIALVLSLELTNSVAERILDIIKAEHHPKIKDAKDIMAAAVTISAIAAFIIGAFIFLPYLDSLV